MVGFAALTATLRSEKSYGRLGLCRWCGCRVCVMVRQVTIEHLVQAEQAEQASRAMRSVRSQLNLARFPLHRDLTDFEFEGTPSTAP